MEHTGTLDILRQHSLRATPARIGILSILQQAGIPISVEYIRTNLPHPCDESTVYRTLEQYCQSGFVHTVQIEPERLYYEFNHGHHHHHLICTECKHIEELPECHITPHATSVAKDSKSFTTVTDHTLEFYGICIDCADRHNTKHFR